MAQLSWRKMSRYLHQSFDVQARPESAVPVRDFGRSLQTGTIFVAPVEMSIDLCENRDNVPIPESALFRRFRLPDDMS